MACELDGHITKPCDTSGAGGIKRAWAISSKFITDYTKDGCEVRTLTTQSVPTTEKFWRVDFSDDITSFFSDATTDADAGAFYRQLRVQIAIYYSAQNRCVLQNILGDKIVFLAEMNSGLFVIAGLTGRGPINHGGMRMAQVIEGYTTSGDFANRVRDLLEFRSEERFTDGIQTFQVAIPNYDGVENYAIGDIVYDNTNDCYFKALTAGSGNALPACGSSNANWSYMTEFDAKREANQTYLSNLINA